jgi:hypothetical protein
VEIPNAYLAYPHANGFADGGMSIVVGSHRDDLWSLRKISLSSGAEELLCEIPAADLPEEVLWFDISLEANLLVFAARGGFYLIDLNSPGEPRRLWEPKTAKPMLATASISEKGDRIVFLDHRDCQHELVIFGTREGCELKRIQMPSAPVPVESPIYNPLAWNHPQISPFNPEWVGFCNNALTHRIPDRLWGWHPLHAPEGRCFLDHRLGGADCRIFTGHERWCFHDLSAVTCAYMTSPDPHLSGLWEVFMDRRPPKQILRHGRIFHCNISRDGAWLVADTFGPQDGPSIDRETWEDDISDILIVNRKTQEFRPLARAHIGLRRPNPPHFPAHPQHGHPTFHPDGRRVFFNDFDRRHQICVVRAALRE